MENLESTLKALIEDYSPRKKEMELEVERNHRMYIVSKNNHRILFISNYTGVAEIFCDYESKENLEDIGKIVDFLQSKHFEIIKAKHNKL